MLRKNINLLLYYEKETFLSKIDPRIKLIKSIIVIISVFLISDLTKLLLLTIIVGLELIILGKLLKKLLMMIIYLSPLIIMILVVNFLATNDIYRTISPVMRFIIFLMSINIFFLTTSPDDFSLTLESLRFPLAISLSFSLALRFVPTVAHELGEIIDAQLSRGLKLDRGNIIQRIKNSIPILIPLLVLSIKRSIEIAQALEIRGLKPKAKRIALKELKLNKNDYIYLALSIVAIIICIYIPNPNL